MGKAKCKILKNAITDEKCVHFLGAKRGHFPLNWLL
jgi:hypothetical protein